MAKKTKEEPVVSVSDAQGFIGRKVVVRGNFAGGDYEYFGTFAGVVQAGEPSVLLSALPPKTNQSHANKPTIPVNLPLRSVLSITPAQDVTKGVK